MSSQQGERRKKHHTIPQFILRNFVDQNGDLYEFDLDFEKSYKKTPKAVAHTKDFYTVDIEGEPSDDVEVILADLENNAAKVVSRIKQHETEFTNAEIDSLVMLVALQRQRVPAQRNQMLDFLDEVERKAKVIAEGAGLDSEEATKDLRRELESTRSRNFLNPFILESLKGVYRLMRRRGWSIVHRSPNAPTFIISDNPVAITVLREDTEPPYRPLIPYGEDSKIVMPISSDTSLVSYYDPTIANEACAGRAIVELFNYQQIINSSKRIYGSEPDFVRLGEGLQTMSWQDVIRINSSSEDME